jgi:hypothetical protein
MFFFIFVPPVMSYLRERRLEQPANREHRKGYEAQADAACQKYLPDFFQAVIHVALTAPV